MRRPLAAAALLAVAVLVSACAAAQAPGWTYAPPTPSPTGGASASAGASAGTSAAPSAEGSAATSAGPSDGSAAPSGGSAAPSGGSGGGSGATLDITALNIKFDKTELSAPANAPFTIHFDNQDPSTQHNIVIKDGAGNEVFHPDLLTGPATVDYSIPALPAGTYTFSCILHPAMTGTLTVGP